MSSTTNLTLYLSRKGSLLVEDKILVQRIYLLLTEFEVPTVSSILTYMYYFLKWM